MKKCQNCNSINSDESKYCNNCGKAFTSDPYAELLSKLNQNSTSAEIFEVLNSYFKLLCKPYEETKQLKISTTEVMYSKFQNQSYDNEFRECFKLLKQLELVISDEFVSNGMLTSLYAAISTTIFMDLNVTELREASNLLINKYQKDIGYLMKTDHEGVLSTIRSLIFTFMIIAERE